MRVTGSLGMIEDCRGLQDPESNTVGKGRRISVQNAGTLLAIALAKFVMLHYAIGAGGEDAIANLATRQNTESGSRCH